MKGQKINRKKAIQPVSTTNNFPLHTPNQRFRLKEGYVIGVVTGLLLAVLAFKLIPTLTVKIRGSADNILTNINKPTPTPDAQALAQTITQKVLPNEVRLGVSYGETVKKLVDVGAIDIQKFLQLYEGRGGLSDKEKKLLEEGSNEEIVVTQQNSGLILNLLWPLGIANKTRVLSDGPMGTEYKNEVGNFASTGGWSVGKVDGGKLFNKYEILPLTQEQEATVKELAENIYRPCCGNSTYFPDCNHGAAMLAFLELAVVQGMPKDEIYKKALDLNAYWFPQTYTELAMYFQTEKNTTWENVDPKEVLGDSYSSGQGYRAINEQLAAKGMIPQVKGGGGCGV